MSGVSQAWNVVSVQDGSRPPRAAAPSPLSRPAGSGPVAASQVRRAARWSDPVAEARERDSGQQALIPSLPSKDARTQASNLTWERPGFF